MSAATAYLMQEDVAEVVDMWPALSDEPLNAHVYEAMDGTFLTVMVTDYQARELDELWYGAQVAQENYEAGTK